MELARRFLIPNNKLDDLNLNSRHSFNNIGGAHKVYLFRYSIHRAMDALVYDINWLGL